ncbi:MAG TPA: hypothetical protein VNN09_09205 [Candidatus Competibacteraceae bacterium]|nr:hypothetical protein [Candidatus Competibacteraceae bacterium]
MGKERVDSPIPVTGCQAMLFTRSGSRIVVDPRLRTDYVDAFYAFSLKFHDLRLYSTGQTQGFLEPLHDPEAAETLAAYADWLQANRHRPLVKRLAEGQPFVADPYFGGKPPLPSLTRLRKAHEETPPAPAKEASRASLMKQLHEAMLEHDEELDEFLRQEGEKHGEGDHDFDEDEIEEGRNQHWW